MVCIVHRPVAAMHASQSRHSICCQAVPCTPVAKEQHYGMHSTCLLLLFAGPSTAEAITVLQPPTTGKALKTRPAYKGMLRSKEPSLCGVGALFRWLVLRFTLLAESIPRPRTRRFKRFFLWLGRTGTSVSTAASHAPKTNRLLLSSHECMQ